MSALAIASFGNDRRAAELSFELADRLLHQVATLDRAADTTPTAPLLGVGLLSRGHGHVAPVVLVSTKFAPTRAVLLEHAPRVQTAVESVMHRSLAGSVWVMGITPPVLQAGPSETAWVEHAGQVRRGTLGPCLIDSAGLPGIMTAGHVAQDLNAVVSDTAGPFGRVAQCVVPERKNAPSADCALILPTREEWQSAQQLSIAEESPPDPDQSVTAYGSHGTRTDSVELFAEWLFIPTLGATVTSVYKTYAPISSPGDSGAPVLLTGSSQIAGTVVAGSNAESYFQAMSVQLRALDARLKPT
jgi:hypothetical protein